jgi:hypothetical protein
MIKKLPLMGRNDHVITELSTIETLYLIDNQIIMKFKGKNHIQF